MTLSVNEEKLTGLRARNCAVTIQRVLILKFAFTPEQFPDLSRNGPQHLSTSKFPIIFEIEENQELLRYKLVCLSPHVKGTDFC